MNPSVFLCNECDHADRELAEKVTFLLTYHGVASDQVKTVTRGLIWALGMCVNWGNAMLQCITLTEVIP